MGEGGAEMVSATVVSAALPDGVASSSPMCSSSESSVDDRTDSGTPPRRSKARFASSLLSSGED